MKYINIKIDKLGSNNRSSTEICGKPQKSLILQGLFFNSTSVNNRNFYTGQEKTHNSKKIATVILSTFHKPCG